MRGNQITLRLNRGFTARAGSLFQYDKGQRLLLTGVELPETYQVHFSNEELGVSKPVIGDASGADIPDEYLVSGQPIHVWVYIAVENHSETEYHGIIGVTRRALPTDMAPSPAQRSLIDQTLGALAAAVEHTEEIRHHVEEMSEGIEESVREELRTAKMAETEEFILTISENGFGKRTSSYEYRTTHRGGNGFTNIKLGGKNTAVAGSFPVTADQDVIMVTDGGKIIRTPVADVRIAGRSTAGVTLFRTAEKEKVVSAISIVSDGDDTDVADTASENESLNEQNDAIAE